MNSSIDHKLKLYIRSEKALLKLELRKKSRQVILLLLATVAFLMTLLMLNVTAFFYLQTQMGSEMAALTLGGMNAVLTLILLLVALSKSSSAEEEALQEIRDYALEEVTEEINGVKADLLEVKQSIEGVITRFKREFLALKGLINIAQLVLEKKSEKKEEEL